MNPIKTIIGIAGGSGAGKSLLARELHRRLLAQRSAADISILNEDNYYRCRNDLSFAEREKINYDHPDAIEHELLVDHLSRLRSGQAINVPQYDYSQHNRKLETVPLEPASILILGGILILHRAEIRDLLDLKIFVDVPLDICLSRRLRRDIVERGRSLDSVLSQYHQTVRPMFFRYIEPSKSHADIIVPRGGENETALNVLYNHLDQLLVKR
jgi:uridine kinase